MARPKSTAPKKVKMNLTVSPETKEMAETIRNLKKISISELLEDVLRKEYKKLVNSGEVTLEENAGPPDKNDISEGE